MRYENWDVLLFPGDSKAPIQEFKTQCSVIQGRGAAASYSSCSLDGHHLLTFSHSVVLPDSPYLTDLSSVVGPQSFHVPQGTQTLLPILSSYIPSLPHGTPFRASIHHWDQPVPSRLMDSLMQPDDVLLFHAQVYIDGIPVS